MEKLKVMTILGTRPEIIRLSECIKKFDKYFNHILVHTGQNYDYNLNEVFFKDLGLRAPNYNLGCVGANLGETMGNIIAKSYDVMLKEKPDAVVVLGDTNSALSVISAKRLKIPIFHMEAGNRCWDWNVSEMINRKLVDSISDINLAYTENSRRYLILEGIDPKTIYVTGSPMMEVFKAQQDKINSSDILTRLNLEKGKYFVVSSHREENIDNEENFYSIMNSINYIAKTYKMPIIFSTHPRTKKMIEKRNFVFDSLVSNLEPLGFFDYNKLQKNSYCVVSDSGTLSEESSICNFAGVLMRTSTERPESLDAGSVVIGGVTERDICQAVDIATKAKEDMEFCKRPESYEEENVSYKVVRIIQSYTSIVNKTVWDKK